MRAATVAQTGDASSRRVRLLLCLAGGWALVAAAVFAGPAQSASAHNYIVSTSPAEGETISVVPALFSVTTNDSLLDVGAAIQVSGPADAPSYFGDGCVTIDGPTAGMPAELGAAGTYTVEWRVTSSDGHPIDGSYEFQWAPDAAAVPAEGAAAPPECGVAVGDSTAEAGAESDGETTGATEASGSGMAGSEWLWALGGLGVVVVGALSAWMLVRRMSDGPPSGGNPADRGPDGNPADRGPDANPADRGPDGNPADRGPDANPDEPDTTPRQN